VTPLTTNAPPTKDLSIKRPTRVGCCLSKADLQGAKRRKIVLSAFRNVVIHTLLQLHTHRLLSFWLSQYMAKRRESSPRLFPQSSTRRVFLFILTPDFKPRPTSSITDSQRHTHTRRRDAPTGRFHANRIVRKKITFGFEDVFSGFVRSLKTWKSHGILKWSFPGLEKSWKKFKS